MNYKERLKDRNEEVRERFQLAGERLWEIALGEDSDMGEELKKYFQKTALFLVNCQKMYQMVEEETFSKMNLEECEKENLQYFDEILPENYGTSYANPDYALAQLGEVHGKMLCFLYTELRSLRIFAFEQDLHKMTILLELFLEIYGMFLGEKVTAKQLRETIYWYLYDYADEWCGWRIQEMLDSSLTFAKDIIMESDFNDLRYLYQYGEYISENERKMSEYLNTFDQEEIDRIALTFTEGYRKGFVLKKVDLSKKKYVNIRYHLGFERVIRAAILQFKEMGLEPIIYRAAYNTLNKNSNQKIGYVSSSPNEQYEYDHRFDNALYLDKRMVDRKVACLRKGYENYVEEAALFAGSAYFDVFGQDAFNPIRKENATKLSERQQNLSVEYSVLANLVMSEFINYDELGFTIIAYPIPAIGKDFEKIFHEMEEVNNLDYDKYEKIQQRLISVLDRAQAVHIMGRGANMSNLTISLQELEDIETQTKFENCLADMNIPLGEVFTSPKLEKTNGLLHIGEVYLNGLCYKNLRLWLEDGMVTDYSCDNFETEEEGKAYIKETILFNRDTLPMGEFAIGTNTRAYVMAQRYGIMDKLPILIAEKMGPHMALGDTCYAYQEEVKVYNPDGREMVAKDNSCSIVRKEDAKKAYFNCHTDITIPYEELDRLIALTPDRRQIPIILDGRFVLEGTLELNDVFMGVE